MRREYRCERRTQRAQPEMVLVRSFPSNPSGLGHGSVPDLLRRVAQSIEDLGDVVVEDITFSSEPTADERDISMTD